MAAKTYSAKRIQISRIAHAIGERALKKKRPALRQKNRIARPGRLIAYDLETTPIRAGTPELRYITVYGEGINISAPVFSIPALLTILETALLTVALSGARFVAWNANKFDVYFIAAACLHSDNYIIRPYLTRSKNLRGLCISHKTLKHSWEFLDGMAMTGIQKPLKNFLKVFAPDYEKLDAPAFDVGEEFNPRNRDHVKYAERDSEGLYHGMLKAESIVKDIFGQHLTGTIGNLGIRLFQANMPCSAEIWPVPYQLHKVIRDFVMRGGYCYCARPYDGPIWKYDINQAYASAMREADLPAGRLKESRKPNHYAKCGIYCVVARHASNKIPFYCRDADTGKTVFAVDGFRAWITKIELDQLILEGWDIKIESSYFWDESFRMRAFVDRLENLRVNAPGGPKGAQGEMVKAIGNNSYGKTIEQLDGLELIMCLDCPDGYAEYPSIVENDIELSHLWYRFAPPLSRDYHQPQLGAHITAHVRMVLRRAILLNPDGWLYADTDCVVFDSPTLGLDIDPARYGAWKIECKGELYRIIGKKVYASHDGKTKCAKGMNVNRLSGTDFASWFAGESPTQTQLQRVNFVKVMSGFDMFETRVRRGSKKNPVTP